MNIPLLLFLFFVYPSFSLSSPIDLSFYQQTQSWQDVSTGIEYASIALNENPFLIQHRPRHLLLNDWKPLDVFVLFQGSIKQSSQLSFTGHCFKKIVVSYVSQTNLTARLKFEVGQAHDLLCQEYILLADAYKMYFHFFVRSGVHVVDVKLPTQDALQDVLQNGMRIFNLQDGALGAVKDVLEFITFFLSPLDTAASLRFLKEYMNVTFVKRPDPSPTLIDERKIRSGDCLFILRLNTGDQMIYYGTGSHSAHTAVALWMDGQLYVVESTSPVILRTPYKKWIDAFAKDKGVVSVMMLPLSDTYRAKFDEQKAIVFFKSVEGRPYGFHNFIFTWVDRTDETNFPSPGTSEACMSYLSLFDHIDHKLIKKVWIEGVNMRFKHYYSLPPVETFAEMFSVLNAHNISYRDVWASPERDEWVYSDGPSMVCVAFVMRLLRAAGIFGSLEIHGTEFTPRDLYSLGIYDTDPAHVPAECKARDPGLNHCILVGGYQLNPPDINTITPYAHMNENCGSLPIKYQRLPKGC